MTSTTQTQMIRRPRALRSLALISTCGAALALAGCQGEAVEPAATVSTSDGFPAASEPATVTAMSPAEGTAMPRNPRDEMEEREYAEAIEGLEFADGLVTVREGLDLSDSDVDAHRADGLDHMQHNRDTDAVRSFVAAVRSRPDEADLYHGLGQALRMKSKTDHAIAAFASALELDPASIDARFDLADELSRANRREEAVQTMQVLIESTPDHGRAHARLAVWQYYAGEYDLAWDHLETARELGAPIPAQLVGLLEAKRAG